MSGGLANLVAQALGLPEWAPRAFGESPVGSLSPTAVFMPVVFREGMTVWVNQETTRVLKLIQPFLDSMATDPARPTPDHAAAGRRDNTLMPVSARPAGTWVAMTAAALWAHRCG